MAKKGSVTRKLLVMGASILATLLVLEVLMRILFLYIRGNHQHPSSVWRDDFLTDGRLGQDHTLLGWTLQTNKTTQNRGWEFEHSIRTNSLGYRDQEAPTRGGRA